MLVVEGFEQSLGDDVISSPTGMQCFRPPVHQCGAAGCLEWLNLICGLRMAIFRLSSIYVGPVLSVYLVPRLSDLAAGSMGQGLDME